MGYRTIVVGTDGSITAGVAAQAAARLAKRFRSELVLVTAYGPPSISRPMAESLVEHAKEDARRERVEAVAELRQGDPAEAILDVAEARGADLVVVGNKGIGEATRFRLGSVPDKVAHRAQCDVLIVDTTGVADPVDNTKGKYRKFLTGTDGSPTANEAARKAFELALMVGADVTLVYVGDPIVGAITLESTAAAKPEGVETQPRVVQGDPSQAICELAEKEAVDLIVVGNKGMTGARRFFLGSVPNKVAHDAQTDVLIVKTVDRTMEDLAPGHGGVVDVKGQRLAVYRDGQGQLHGLSPRCTHMGCTVDWNDSDRTWDCPCHGSRYAAEDGEVIRGPALKGLAPQKLPS
jgi:nucleotide-binding universal stress UspA family protein/nitrite reductase/ring-hydroxylating ferredoxin subunit